MKTIYVDEVCELIGDLPIDGQRWRRSKEELLFYAAQEGEWDEVERLLDHGVSIHSWVFEEPLLAQAVSNPNMTSLLLSRGANACETLPLWIGSEDVLDATIIEYLIDYYEHDEDVMLYAATLTLLLEAGASHVVRNQTVPDELRQVLDRYACVRQLRADTAPVITAPVVARRL